MTGGWLDCDENIRIAAVETIVHRVGSASHSSWRAALIKTGSLGMLGSQVVSLVVAVSGRFPNPDGAVSTRAQRVSGTPPALGNPRRDREREGRFGG